MSQKQPRNLARRRTVLGFIAGLCTSLALTWAAREFVSDFPPPPIKATFRTDAQDAEEVEALKGWNPNKPLWGDARVVNPSSLREAQSKEATQGLNDVLGSATSDLLPNIDAVDVEEQAILDGRKGLGVIEAGEFQDSDQAGSRARQLLQQGIEARVVSTGKGGYTLRMGPYEESQTMRDLNAKLKRIGYKPRVSEL